MTVKEVKEALKDLPDNMDVFVAERKTGFGYGLVNSVFTKEIAFSEDPDHIPTNAPKVKVVVFDEE